MTMGIAGRNRRKVEDYYQTKGEYKNRSGILDHGFVMNVTKLWFFVSMMGTKQGTDEKKFV